MLETIITSINGESLPLLNALIIILSSIVIGLIISFTYIKTHKIEGYSPNFTVTLIILPVIISIIILLVGNNVARAFSLAGAFSIIRFRSVIEDTKDITYIFFILAVGLTCGMGYIGYTFIFTIVICALIMVLHATKFFMPKTKTSKLKITIPEDLNYDGIFDDILEKYTSSWKMETIRTRDFGSLFEIHYIIQMKFDVNQKKFIDELRCKNGNLNISLTFSGFEEKVYN